MMKKKSRGSFFKVTRIFLASIVFLALVQIYVSQRLATAGKVVGELEGRAAQIEEDNERLEESINQKTSLVAIFKKAQELGFRPTGDVLYLTSEIPVALGSKPAP